MSPAKTASLAAQLEEESNEGSARATAVKVEDDDEDMRDDGTSTPPSSPCLRADSRPCQRKLKTVWTAMLQRRIATGFERLAERDYG
jgi:hypothetical protein